MNGVSLRDGTLVVERDPNELDDLAIGFSTVVSRLDIQHVFAVVSTSHAARWSSRSRM